MTDVSNALKAGAPPGVLSNSQVLAFIAAQWMRRPWMFAATVVLVMVGLGADLFFPAAEHLTKAVAGDPAHDLGAVWNAWGLFVAVYVAPLAFRDLSFFFMIPSPRGTWRTWSTTPSNGCTPPRRARPRFGTARTGSASWTCRGGSELVSV